MTQHTYMPQSTDDTSYSTPVLSNVLPGFIPELRGHCVVVLQEVQQPHIPTKVEIEDPIPRHRKRST